ncbi:hypothetical protein JCM3774_005995 [Rhodotorula dairenensis]
MSLSNQPSSGSRAARSQGLASSSRSSCQTRSELCLCCKSQVQEDEEEPSSNDDVADAVVVLVPRAVVDEVTVEVGSRLEEEDDDGGGGGDVLKVSPSVVVWPGEPLLVNDENSTVEAEVERVELELELEVDPDVVPSLIDDEDRLVPSVADIVRVKVVLKEGDGGGADVFKVCPSVDDSLEASLVLDDEVTVVVERNVDVASLELALEVEVEDVAGEEALEVASSVVD